MPTKEQIKQCLNSILLTPTYKGKQTQMGGPPFATLLQLLNTQLELKGYDTLNTGADKDKKEVAKIIYADYKSSLIESGGKIGPYMTSQLADTGFQAPQGNPQYTILNTQYQAGKPLYNTVRSEVVKFLGIRDAGHLQHGSNFTGSQTLQQIIDNVFAKVQGQAERNRVSANSQMYYHYNPMG